MSPRRRSAREIFSPVVERLEAGGIPVLLVRGAGRGARPLLVHHHGANAAKEADLLFFLRVARRGWTVAAPDAPFHGERGVARRPSFARVWAASLARAAAETRTVLDLLLRDRGVDRRRVAVSGKSMGAFRAALAVGADRRIGALVSLIGGGDIARLVARSSSPDVRSLPPVRRLAGSIRALDPVAHAARIARVPALVLAGGADTVVPPACAAALAAALRRSGGRVVHRAFAGVGHRLVPAMEAAVGRFLDGLRPAAR